MTYDITQSHGFRSGTQSLWLGAAASGPDASDFALDLAQAILRRTGAVAPHLPPSLWPGVSSGAACLLLGP